MSEQMNLFPTLHGQIDVKGDVATCQANVLWTIEKFVGGFWSPLTMRSYLTRKDARDAARIHRQIWQDEVRVVPYKRGYDSKFRPNRQVQSERLDY
jgi:hypothetical protein